MAGVSEASRQEKPAASELIVRGYNPNPVDREHEDIHCAGHVHQASQRLRNLRGYEEQKQCGHENFQ